MTAREAKATPGRRLPTWTIRMLYECRAVLLQEAENYRDADCRGKPNYQPAAKSLHRLADRISRALAKAGAR